MPRMMRLAAVLLACLFLAAILLSAAFVAARTAHCCSHGVDCVICSALSRCERLMRGFFLLVPAAVIVRTALLTWLVTSDVPAAFCGHSTPVMLRVKLTD